jgi:molybdopterin molybdotransferase
VDYVRVKFDGALVTPIMTSGASILSSTTRADGVVLVPAGSEGHGEDEEVEVFLYD